MKYFLILLLAMNTCSLRAALHIVQVADFSFTPTNVNAICGDTVLWVWVGGTHTTTSVSIPSCANGWNGQLSATSLSVAYLVPCAGTYVYNCAIHSSMIGTITATCATGTQELNANIAAVFPNPFSGRLTIQPGSNDFVRVTDSQGREVASSSITRGSESMQLDLDVAPALYFLLFYEDGKYTNSLRVMKE